MYMINPLWFYLIGIVENLQGFFIAIGALGVSISIIVSVVLLVEGGILAIKKQLLTFFITSLIFCFIGSLIPNKETCYSMAIASVATTENLEYAAEAGKNIIDYITEKAIELIEAGE